MFQKSLFVVFAFFLFQFIFSQQKTSLNGKIKSNEKIISEAILELKLKENSKFAVSNNDGNYHFTVINAVLKDTLTLYISGNGYKSVVKTIIVNNENMVLDVDLEAESIINLKEVVVKADEKTLHTANKSIYKINQKNFIKNAKAPDVLSTVPNVYHNKFDGKTIVDGTLTAKIFIDGVEAMPNEIKQIKASSIDKVEVLNNPSASYGTDFLGAIVNIITKKTTEQFFKGSLGLTGGIKNNYWAISPSIGYKKGIFSVSSDMQYLQNNQIILNELTRNDANSVFIQNSTDKTNGIQNYFNLRMGLKFSEKSDFTITGYNGGYNFKGNTVGTSSLNSTNSNEFINSNDSKNTETEIASVYKYKIKENKTLYFKNLYVLEYSFYSGQYNNLPVNYLEVNSKKKELTWNVNYNIEAITIFKKPATVTSDFKYINRKYSFSNTDFYINQNIFNATFDVNNDWSEKFSTQSSVTFEHSNNGNDVFSKNYNLILPIFNALYHFKNKIDVGFGYSRRILRPSPGDLNEALIISSPGIASQGNSNLDQQLRNYFSLTFSKAFKSDNISLKFFDESINNSIENVYKKQGLLLIRTFENVGKFNSTGFDFGYTTKILKKVNLNLNSGLKYNIVENTNSISLIKKNSGISFNGSVNLDTNFFKDKLSVSFSGYQDGPNYTLLSKSITYPFLDLSLSTNVFKDKLNIRLYLQNILGEKASGSKDITNVDNFYEQRVSKNNFSNLLLSLTYNFGKTFDDIEINKIENDDVRR